MQCVSKKYVQGIEKEVKIKNPDFYGMLSNDDMVSCTERLQLLNQEKEGLFYNNLEEITNLEDAEIVICDQLQLKYLKEYGNEYICMDTTFGKNAYDLKLTAVLVTNEFRCGVPVLNIITKKIDEPTIRKCFLKLKAILGDFILTPNVFMSDDDKVYYKAWCTVMGKPAHKLLCTWHVYKAWEAQLKKKVGTKESKPMLAELLNLKTNILGEREFLKRWMELKKEWEGTEDKKRVVEYLEKYYMNRAETWANCYRVGLVLTTNNYAESFFNTFKHTMLPGAKKDRMDIFLHALLNRSRVDAESMNKLIKKGAGFKDKKTQKVHRTSMCTVTILERQDGLYEWLVNVGDKQFRVKRVECVNCKCMNRCVFCNVCVKMFECECPVNRVNDEICVHIHFVCMVDVEIALELSRKEKPKLPVRRQIEPPPSAQLNEYQTAGKNIDAQIRIYANRIKRVASKKQLSNKLRILTELKNADKRIRKLAGLHAVRGSKRKRLVQPRYAHGPGVPSKSQDF